MKRFREEEEGDIVAQKRRKIIAYKPEESVYGDGGAWLRGRFLGEGGFGAVHLAHFPNPTLSERFEGFPSLVAVKSTDCSMPKELLWEKALYGFFGQSPFVIRCFGDDVTVAEDGGLLLNVFIEYASGGTLYDLIKNSNGSGLLESQARGFTLSILGGIKVIHEASLIHCDLKPENVLLVEDGEVFVAKIGDLGLGKSVEGTEKFIRGTQMYLAPECYKQGIQGLASDIWALGCVVLSMLTGRLEWAGAPTIQGKFSEEAEDFVRKCLSRNPSDRPTAATLLSHPFVTASDVQQGDHEQSRQSNFTLETGVCDDSSSFIPLPGSSYEEEEEEESDVHDEDDFDEARMMPVAIMGPRRAEPGIASTVCTKGFVILGAA